MAITLSAAPAVVPVRLVMLSDTGDSLIKNTEIDGGYDNTEMIAFLTALDNVSNASFTGKVGGRVIAGQKGSPISAMQNMISVFMVLNFEKADPLNAAAVVSKSYTVPAFKEVLRTGGSGSTPDVGTPGTGSPSEYLGTLIAFLEDNLGYLGADAAYYNGGWTYAGGAFGTGADLVDGI